MDQGRDRGRAGHRVRQPDVERDLRALGGGTPEKEEADKGRRGDAEDALAGQKRRQLLDFAEDEGQAGAVLQGVAAAVPAAAEGPEQAEEADQEAKIADAVGDEGLHARRGVFQILVPEGDQQVGAEADALPANEHEDEIIRQHQGEHGEHEEVHIGKEAPVALILVHIADAVDVDQGADEGDHQGHGAGEGVEQKGHRHVKIARADPVEEGVDQLPLLRREAHETDKIDRGDDEAQGRHEDGQGMNGRFAPATVDFQTKGAIDKGPQER